MSIVGGFDVHRQQITFDYVDTGTGELCRGQIRPATRMVLRAWLGERFTGRADVAFAVEGCTGWRFIAEELARAGVGGPHVGQVVLRVDGRAAGVAAAALSPAGRQSVDTVLAAIDALTDQIDRCAGS